MEESYVGGVHWPLRHVVRSAWLLGIVPMACGSGPSPGDIMDASANPGPVAASEASFPSSDDAGGRSPTVGRDAAGSADAAASLDAAQSPHVDAQPPTDAPAAIDVTASEDSGIYHAGSGYTCCGRGEGVTCCTADAGLAGVDVLPDGALVKVGDWEGQIEANCFPYGGSFGRCLGDRGLLDGKDICALCCPGLVRVAPAEVDDAGACVQTAPPSAFECLPCGDGMCQAEENRCTCPADCR